MTTTPESAPVTEANESRLTPEELDHLRAWIEDCEDEGQAYDKAKAEAVLKHLKGSAVDG